MEDEMPYSPRENYYIGSAVGATFWVIHEKNIWWYEANLSEPYLLDSQGFYYTVTPSYEHFRQWVIDSIQE